MLWTTYSADVRIGMQAAHLSGQRPTQASTERAIHRDDPGHTQLRMEVGGAAARS